MNVGKRIKEERLRQGLTQTELGNRLGIQHQVVYGYESGARTPSLPRLEEIAKALNVEPEELIRPLARAK